MKKLKVLGLAASTLLATSPTFAQNTVTLYGVVDTGLMYVHNSDGKSTQVMMSAGTESGSRFGLKGGEDLGGGLKAIFQIENGFNSTNGNLGQGKRMFGRQAYIGLTQDGLGTLTLGRQYDPLIDLVQQVQGDNWLGGFFTSPGDIDNADNSARVDNAVKWASPDWAGLKLSAMYSFGGVAGTTGSRQTYSAAAAYNNGPLLLATGYLHIDNGNAATGARPTSTMDSLFNSSVNGAYSSARSINIARIGGDYTLGSATFGTSYSNSQYNPDANSTFSRTEKYNNVEVHAVYQFTPALVAEAGYDYMKSTGDSSAKQNQFALGLDYNLSKRTDVYAVAAYALAMGQNGAGTAQAVIGSIEIDSKSNKQAIVTAGLRHKF